MKLIGVEEHMMTAEVRAAWDAAGLAAAPGYAPHGGAVERRLLDLSAERISLMDETGLDVQVLSLTTPALHDLGAEGVDLARRVNDALAGAVARYPARFGALATLPMASPDAAARELERCVEGLGFAGAMVCGRVGAKNLDDPAFAPVLAAAASLGAPLLLHPQVPTEAVRGALYAGFAPAVDDAFASYALGWHYEAGIQFLRLVLSGTFDRMPNLQVILGHWGEVVLFYAERLAALDRVSGLAHPVAHYMRSNLHVTGSGMVLPHYLRRAAAVVGTDRLLFSTDYPYQYRPGREARAFLDACGLGPADAAALAHGNWERLTGGIGVRPSSHRHGPRP